MQSEEEGRSKLTTPIKEAVEKGGNAPELVCCTKVKILNLDDTTKKDEIKDAVKGHFGQSQIGEFKVTMTKKDCT